MTSARTDPIPAAQPESAAGTPAVRARWTLPAGAAGLAGTALLAAGLFLQAQFGVRLRPPGTTYSLSVLGGPVISLGIIAANLPLPNRITGPDTARNEQPLLPETIREAARTGHLRPAGITCLGSLLRRITSQADRPSGTRSLLK